VFKKSFLKTKILLKRKMASRKEKIDRFLIIGMFIFGFVLFYLVNKGYKYIDKNCEDNIIRGCMTAILALSTAMITASIAYFVCFTSTSVGGVASTCYQGGGNDNTASIYFGMAFLISLGLIACSILIMVEAGKKGKPCGGKNLSNLLGVPVLVLSTLLAIGTGYGAGFAIKGIVAHNRGGQSKAQAADISGF
jgi:hypothetical protein